MADEALVDQLATGIAGVESGGKYDAQGPVTSKGDRAYGKYQIMGTNVPAWTQEALGTSMDPQAFLADPDAQEKTARYRLGKYLDESGDPRDAAAKWHSGVGYQQAIDEGRADQLGTTTRAYADRVAGGIVAAKPNTYVRLPDDTYVNMGADPTPEMFAQLKAKMGAKFPQVATGAPPSTPPAPLAADVDFAADPRFNTQLTPDEEAQFQQWKAVNAPRDSGVDYDLRGAFKAGLAPNAETGHFSDRFKKPNHPTFSDQSQYASLAPERAGSWQGDRFIPPAAPPERPTIAAPSRAFVESPPVAAERPWRDLEVDQAGAEMNRAMGYDADHPYGQYAATIGKPITDAVTDVITGLFSPESPSGGALTDPHTFLDGLSRAAKLLHPLAVPGEMAGNLANRLLTDAGASPNVAAAASTLLSLGVGAKTPVPGLEPGWGMPTVRRTLGMAERPPAAMPFQGTGATRQAATETATTAQQADEALATARTTGVDATTQARTAAQAADDAAMTARAHADDAARAADDAAARVAPSPAQRTRAEAALTPPHPTFEPPPSAARGEPFEATGYRLGGEETMPGRGTFYMTNREAVGDFAAGENVATAVTEQPLKLSNVLRVSEDQTEAAEVLMRGATAGERSTLQSALKPTVGGEPDYLALDTAIGRAARRQGYDGVVYHNEHLGGGATEVVDLRAIPTGAARVTPTAGSRTVTAELGRELKEITEPVKGIYDAVVTNADTAAKALGPDEGEMLLGQLDAVRKHFGNVYAAGAEAVKGATRESGTLPAAAREVFDRLEGALTSGEKVSARLVDDFKQQLDDLFPGKVPYGASPMDKALWNFKWDTRDALRTMFDGEDKLWAEAADKLYRDEIVGKGIDTALGPLTRLARKSPATFVERVFGTGATDKNAMYATAVMKYLRGTPGGAALNEATLARAVGKATDTATGALDPKKLLSTVGKYSQEFRDAILTKEQDTFFKALQQEQGAVRETAEVAQRGAQWATTAEREAAAAGKRATAARTQARAEIGAAKRAAGTAGKAAELAAAKAAKPSKLAYVTAAGIELGIGGAAAAAGIPLGGVGQLALEAAGFTIGAKYIAKALADGPMANLLARALRTTTSSPAAIIVMEALRNRARRLGLDKEQRQQKAPERAAS